MRSKMLFVSGLIVALTCMAKDSDGQWVQLFDGSTLSGWKAAASNTTFSVKDGCIVAHGPRAHLFYLGTEADHDWTDFELTMDVKTFPVANSGVYFHTRYQEVGFPEAGYQVQINNSNPYPSMTASLYGVEDRLKAPVGDNVWFELSIRVEGKRIITKVNNATICDYVEPANPVRKDEVKGSILGHGTIALQGHDKDSETWFKNIRIRSLKPKDFTEPKASVSTQK